MKRIEGRRQAIIDRTRRFEPADLDQLLAESEDGYVFLDLEWVEVPSPWQSEDGVSTVNVRPVIACGKGSEEGAREKHRFDKGVYQLILDGRLTSDGKELLLGGLTFFCKDGKFKYEPELQMHFDNANPIGNVRWDSADAELFLKLAELALDAQPH
ncbi:hypothetical protein A3J32_02390 [Candidatus Saccharibacteria bacterium RIFCSPLOWO2_02_FULL_46_7]|nr:MAG: hypothetical protein A3J32_02390 [Candidatus Saccharibacteria bacterium RIFCSPLOWO2_02_FULL_46_7]